MSTTVLIAFKKEGKHHNFIYDVLREPVAFKTNYGLEHWVYKYNNVNFWILEKAPSFILNLWNEKTK